MSIAAVEAVVVAAVPVVDVVDVVDVVGPGLGPTLGDGVGVSPVSVAVAVDDVAVLAPAGALAVEPGAASCSSSNSLTVARLGRVGLGPAAPSSGELAGLASAVALAAFVGSARGSVEVERTASTAAVGALGSCSETVGAPVADAFGCASTVSTFAVIGLVRSIADDDAADGCVVEGCVGNAIGDGSAERPDEGDDEVVGDDVDVDSGADDEIELGVLAENVVAEDVAVADAVAVVAVRATGTSAGRIQAIGATVAGLVVDAGRRTSVVDVALSVAAPSSGSRGTSDDGPPV